MASIHDLLIRKELSKYPRNGSFTFKPSEDLKLKCNAPTDCGGVYLIYKISTTEKELIYIGSSGQNRDGEIKVRRSGLGGMKDRLVNGYHPKFGRTSRRKTFPEEMTKTYIDEIEIHWWATHNDNTNKDFPTEVENKLLELYKTQNSTNPIWHKQ